MRKITSLFALLLLCAASAWAADVTVINSSQDAATYGSFSSETFTTNAASGLAGLTVSGIKGTTATSFSYGACLALEKTQNGTITITAPDGYNITGYSLTARSGTYRVPYTLTPSAGGSAVSTTTTGVSLSATGLNAQSASFTYSASEANSFYIPALTVTVVSASAQLVEVTYNLYDEGDATIKATEIKTQEANSAINIPASFVNDTYFDYTTSGTIGDTDCTISVVRTPKNGVVYPLSNLNNNKAYQLTTARGSLGTNGTQMVSTNGTSFTASNFAIISYEGNYYLWSVADSKWVSANSQPTLTTNVDEAGKVVLTETNAPYFFMGMGSLGVNVASGYYVSGTNQLSGIVVNSYTTTDPGNQYVITEAADFDPTEAIAALDAYFHPSATVTYVISDAGGVVYTSDPLFATIGETITELPSSLQRGFCSYNVTATEIVAGNNNVPVTVTYNLPFTVSTSFDNATWYYATIRGSKYLRADDSNKDSNGRYTTNSTNEKTDAYKWAFFGSPYSYFYVMNKAQGAGKYLYAATYPEFQSLADPTTVDAALWAPTVNGEGFSLRNITGANLYINDAANTGNLGFWDNTAGATDAGGRIVVTEVPSDLDAFNAAIAELEAVNWGSAVHQYSFTGDYAGYAGSESTIIAGLKSEGYTATNLAIVEDMLNNYGLNLPTAGFYRIKSTHDTYLSGTESTASAGRLSLTTNSDASTIFYFDGTYLYNFEKGTAALGREVGIVGTEGIAYWFEASTKTIGKYAIRFNPDGGSNRFLYAWDTSKNYADQNGSDHVNCAFTLEEVAELPLTLNEVDGVYYATFYAPVAVSLPSGVTAYTMVINTSDSQAKGTNLGQDVPAETPVVLKGSSASVSATVNKTNTDAAVTSDLKGTLIGVAAPLGETKLSLGKAEGEVGFYQYSYALKGFRAYLEVPAGSSSRSFVITFDDDVTAINGVNAAVRNGAAVYDLQGRRVNNATKGVYIVNGKKVLF